MQCYPYIDCIVLITVKYYILGDNDIWIYRNNNAILRFIMLKIVYGKKTVGHDFLLSGQN